MKIVLVHNAKSGSALSLTSLKKKFKKNNIEIEKDIKIEPGFEKKLKPFLKPKQIIAAIGGDGTISAVAGIVAETPAILAPLSGGTLNHFTKDLGVSQDIDKAIAHLKKAKQQKIDIAKVNNIVFINNSSIGLYPSSLKVREDTESTLGKWPAAAFGIIKALIRYKTYIVTINQKTFATPFIFIGNNPYEVNDFALTNRKSLSKGQLSIYVTKAHSRFALIKIFAHATTGKLHEADEFESYSANEITIKAHGHKKIYVSHDGEVSKVATPLAYKIVPKSLNILK